MDEIVHLEIGHSRLLGSNSLSFVHLQHLSKFKPDKHFRKKRKEKEMAVSSTTACMPHREMPPLLVKPCTNISNVSLSCFKYKINHTNNVDVATLTRKGCWRFVARSSEDASSETTTTTTTTTEESWEGEGEERAVELPTAPPSLISTLNVEKILRGIAITDVDHYARLGLPRGCSYDQVGAAYQNKVKELLSQGLDKEEYDKEFELLKESYNILFFEEQRRLYDWSLARSGAPDRYTWPFESEVVRKPRGSTPPKQEPEDVGPTIAVGYFMLGWFLLAAVVSIALNLQ